MALQKDIELDSGFVGNYWRLASVHVNCDGDLMVSISMFLYKDRNVYLLYHLRFATEKKLSV